MKKIILLPALLIVLSSCSENKTDNYIGVNIWKDDQKIDTVYILENSKNNINMSTKFVVWENGVRKEINAYLKAYSILEGFYGADGVKYFDSTGKCLVDSWGASLPTDVYCTYKSFDGYNFFTYTNNGDPRQVTINKFNITGDSLDLINMSLESYLQFDLSFRGKGPNGIIDFKIYDRNDNSKECFYTGSETFSNEYTEHHILFKVSARAAKYGTVIMDYSSLSTIYAKDEVLKISFSTSAD